YARYARHLLSATALARAVRLVRRLLQRGGDGLGSFCARQRLRRRLRQPLATVQWPGDSPIAWVPYHRRVYAPADDHRPVSGGRRAPDMDLSSHDTGQRRALLLGRVV